MCIESVISNKAISPLACKRFADAIKPDHMQAMQAMVYSYHPNTAIHHNGTGLLAAELTAHFSQELDDNEAIEVIQAAYTHDFGKLAMSQAILDTSEIFTDDEKQRMKEHPERGYHKVVEITKNPEAAIPILMHHSLQPDSYPDNETTERILLEHNMSPKVLEDKKIWLKNIIVIAADQGEARYPSKHSTHPYGKRDYPVEELEQKISTDLSSAKLIEHLQMTKHLEYSLKVIGQIAIKSSKIMSAHDNKSPFLIRLQEDRFTK